SQKPWYCSSLVQKWRSLMKLDACLVCPLLSGVILALFPSGGPGMADPPKPKVTLTVTQIRGYEFSTMEAEGELKGKEVRYLLLACDALIDNETGEELTVTSSFSSAFDGLSLQILRGGRKVGEQPYVMHQSP